MKTIDESQTIFKPHATQVIAENDYMLLNAIRDWLTTSNGYIEVIVIDNDSLEDEISAMVYWCEFPKE